MKVRTTQTDFWFRVFLFAFFGFLYFISSSYPQKSKQFPHLIAIFSLIMIVISLVIDFTRKGIAGEGIAEAGNKEVKGINSTSNIMKINRFYKAWGIILISTAVGLLIGFLFSTFFLFMGFAIFFGEKKNLMKNVVIAVLMTILIYLSFQLVMGIPLLTGILLDFS